MKKLLLIPSLLLSTLLYSQNIFIEFDITGEAKLSKGQLIINDSISYWNEIYDETTILSEKQFFIKKKWENKIYYNEEPFSHTFYVKDSLHNMKWQLTGDTKMILDEKCNSATTHFRGRNYIVYYTTSLAYSDGPWKFGGLPGVILEAKSDDNLYQHNAVKLIKNYSEKIEPVNITKYKFIEWDEFVKKFIANVDNAIKLLRSTSSNDFDTEINIKIGGREIIYPKVQTSGISY